MMKGGLAPAFFLAIFPLYGMIKEKGEIHHGKRTVVRCPVCAHGTGEK